MNLQDNTFLITDQYEVDIHLNNTWVSKVSQSPCLFVQSSYIKTMSAAQTVLTCV